MAVSPPTRPAAPSPHRRDTRLVYLMQAARYFAFGYASVLLALYLARFGFDALDVGLFGSVGVLSGVGVTLLVARNGDRMGRRRLLVLTSPLLIGAGLLFALAHSWVWLLAGALLGALPPGGGAFFASLEQAILAQNDPQRRPAVYATYGLVGNACNAMGALAAGLPSLLAARGLGLMAGYRLMYAGVAGLGFVFLLLALRISPAAEVQVPAVERRAGLGRSRPLVMRLAALFVADSFGSALLTTPILVYWLHTVDGMAPAQLALLFFGIHVANAVSYPLSVPIARRLGLVNTAVFTHIPSNVLLLVVPFAPGALWAGALLVARGFLSQMDVPTRQAYIAAVVDPDERTAAAGVTTAGKQVGYALGPTAGGMLLAAAGSAAPFVIAGLLKTAYDLTLWRSFRHVAPRT